MAKLMSQKEVKRAQVLDLLIASKTSQQEAAQRLCIKTRQVRRLTKRYQAAGLSGLIHEQVQVKIAASHVGRQIRDVPAVELVGCGGTERTRPMSPLRGPSRTAMPE